MTTDGTEFILRARRAIAAGVAALCILIPGLPGSAGFALAGEPTPDIKVSVLDGARYVELVSDPSGTLAPIEFGSTAQGDEVVRHFLIENAGDADLVLAGTIALEPDDDFSVVDVLTPDQLTIAPGGSLPFSIRMNAFSQGVKLDLVRIQSNDPDADQDPFRFRVEGFVQQPPEVALQVDSDAVPSGGMVLFAPAMPGVEAQRTFTISNAGTQPLSIGPVSAPDGFELLGQPAAELLSSGDSTAFTVRVRTDIAGPRSGLLTFSTGDPDESPYAVRLVGTVARTDDGPKPGVRAAREVSGAGDIDGDGFDDVILGSRDGDDAGNDAGQAYVFSGRTGDLLYQFNGETPGDRFGWALAPLGDLNGDGLDDIAISAANYSVSGLGPGRVYVFYARPAGTPLPITISAADADVIITGEGPEDSFGNSIAPAGDVNLDGIEDLLIGSPGHEGPAGVNAGRAYVFGDLGPGATKFRSVIDAMMICDGEQAFSNFGAATSSLGDVNGDGFPDFVVGASSGGTPLIGRVYVFFSPFATSPAVPFTVPASSADFRFEGLTVAERFGRTVLGPGDLDGDAVPDLLVGAPATSPVVLAASEDDGEAGAADESGGVYAFLLNPFGSTQIISASGAAHYITGEMPQDSFASALASAGDFDRDGLGDFIVGAPDFDGDGTQTENWGRAYLFASPWAGGVTAPAPFSLAPDAARATITGEGRNDRLGIAVAFGGDVNADGAPDALIGAPNNDQGTGLNSHNGGRGYTLFGDPLACRPQWTAGEASIGSTGVNGSVRALAAFAPYAGAEQLLHAGGLFTQADGQAASGIARWTGSHWEPLGVPGSEGVSGQVYALAAGVVAGQRRLFVGGSFSTAGGRPAMSIAAWDGQGWHSLGDGLAGTVRALCIFDDGSGPALYAGGDFVATGGGLAVNRLARWDGNTWQPVGGGVNDSVYALASFDDGTGESLFAGGRFTTAGSPVAVAAPHLAAWDGAGWRSLGGGVNGQVSALCAFGTGSQESLIVAGNFTTAGSPTPVSAPGIARWSSLQWSALGGGLGGGGAFPFANALAVYDDGTGGGDALYVAGSFTTASGLAAPRIARWDGAKWSGLDAGLDDTAYALAVFDEFDGKNLAVGGRFLNASGFTQNRVACWDGCRAVTPVVFDRFGDGERSILWEQVQFAGGTAPAVEESAQALRFAVANSGAPGSTGAAGYGAANWSIDTDRDWALRCGWTADLPPLSGRIEVRLEFPRSLTPVTGAMTDGAAVIVGRDAQGAFARVERLSAGTVTSFERIARSETTGEFFVWYDHTADTLWASTTGFDGSGALPVHDFRQIAASSLTGVRLLALSQGPHPAVSSDSLALQDFRVLTGLAVQSQPPAACPGDTDGSGAVDFADLQQVLSSWAQSVEIGSPGDALPDGFVDFGDLSLVLGNWAVACP